MGKKCKNINSLAVCYYCERSFSNERNLITHQKARHFACAFCRRKLNTATGLAIHWLQVHKQTINSIPNALAGRGKIGLTIRGLVGLPEAYLAELQERQAAAQTQKVKKQRYKHVVVGSGIIEIENNDLKILDLPPNDPLLTLVRSKLDMRLMATSRLSKNKQDKQQKDKKLDQTYKATNDEIQLFSTSSPVHLNKFAQTNYDASVDMRSNKIIRATVDQNSILIWTPENVSPEELRAAEQYKIPLVF